MSDFLEIAPDTAKNTRTINELNELSADLQQKAIRSSLHAAAVPLVQAMKSAAPDDPSTPWSSLSASINKVAAKTGKSVRTGAGVRTVSLGENEVALIVGPNKKIKGRNMHGVASITEWGSKQHIIGPKADKNMRIGKTFVAGTVMHPGVRAKHWMSGALQDTESRFEALFYTGLEKWLNKYGR